MINSKVSIPSFFILSLMFTGCEMLGPRQHEKMPLEKISQQQMTEKPAVIYQELSNTGTAENEDNQAKVEKFYGSGRYVNSHSKPKPKLSKGKGEYSLNFDDADLGEVAKVILSDILQENYVISPKVSGKVTLQTSQPLSRSELLPTLDMLLSINNAAMTYQDGLYQIKSKTEALNSSAFSTYKNYRQKMPAGYQIRMIPVKNVAVEELAEIIKPLLQDKTILHIDSKRNIILAAGTDAQLDRVMDIVSAFDIDVMKGRSFGLFPLKNVDAAKMIQELEKIFSKEAGSEKGLFQFLQIERLNAILVIANQAKFLNQVERWVYRLDKANTAAGGGVIVYRAQHVDAVELADTLNEIFSQGNKKNKPASIAAGRKSVAVTNKKTKNAKVNTNTAKPTINKRTLSDVGDVKIIADETNNALIIVATAQDYTVVQRVIEQLDVMPLQVLIDATIVDVTLKDNLKYGIKWFLSHNNGGENAASSGGGNDFFDSTTSSFSSAASTAAAVSTGGFGYAFLSNSKDISAVLNAEALKNNVNVISSPSIMVLNNQEANIQVGNEVSLRTSESTPLTGGVGTNNTPISTTTVQQRKTGVTVNVKPRVNANGLVIMEIEQKIEDFAGGATNGNPDILTRELKSSVAVQSGETIVLGGLINEKYQNNKDGIPILHELPLIGTLFGSTDKQKTRTELVVLITPRVVKSRLDAKMVTNEFKRKLSGIYENIDKSTDKTQTQASPMQ